MRRFLWDRFAGADDLFLVVVVVIGSKGDVLLGSLRRLEALYWRNALFVRVM